jgi:hypothetical protein
LRITITTLEALSASAIAVALFVQMEGENESEQKSREGRRQTTMPQSAAVAGQTPSLTPLECAQICAHPLHRSVTQGCEE